MTASSRGLTEVLPADTSQSDLVRREGGSGVVRLRYGPTDSLALVPCVH